MHAKVLSLRITPLIIAISIIGPRRFFQNKVGAAKITVFIQVILKDGNAGFLVRFGIRLLKKTFQPELTITPIADNIIITIENLRISFAKRFLIPSVFVVFQQLICFVHDMYQNESLHTMLVVL